MADIVYLVRDLLFTSKIRETAAQRGRSTFAAPDQAALCEAARSARLVILDLRLPSALDALRQLRSMPETEKVRTVGFIDHEKEDVMEAAKRLGLDEAMAKGKFSTSLPRLMELVVGPQAD
jgi:CheY-like chemotaxis protein